MDTLRAGERKCQSSKEQFRWKIGTAPARMAAGAVVRAGSVGGDVRSVIGAAGRACHSWPEGERGVAGMIGARLSAGLAQHARVAQLLSSRLQHLQSAVARAELSPAVLARPCQPVAMQSRRPSRADKVF